MRLPPNLEELRGNTVYSALRAVSQDPPSLNYVQPNGVLPVVVPGGMGDLIVNIPILRYLQKKFGEIRVHTNNSEALSYFGLGDRAADGPRPPYLYYLKLSTAPVWIYKGDPFRTNLDRMETSHRDLFTQTRYPTEEVKRFAAYQPFFDGELAREAVSQRLTRTTLPRAILSAPLNDAMYPRFVPKNRPKVDVEPFITMNTGFDATQIDIGMRSTKSWHMRSWAYLVESIKDKFPKYWIFQIGGPNSRPIPGVDENLAGKLTLSKSFDLLARSRLHIDIEGGLVHAAHALGVKSLVFFGSTPADFFGYPENINLSPKICGGCWWTTRSWMSQCPVSDRPDCLESISPQMAEAAVCAELEERLC